MFISQNKENTPVVFKSKKESFNLKEIKEEINILTEKNLDDQKDEQESEDEHVYDEEILQCYLDGEKKNRIELNFIETSQSELTISNRKTIVEWLIDYHQKCKLKQESLFLAIQLFDRYLISNDIKRKDIQVRR